MTQHTEPFLLAADAVAPMDPALPRLLPHAGVVIAGDRIAAVGDLADLRQQFGELPGKQVRGVLLPGFVNAHTHLELSYQSAPAERPAHFTRWVSALMASSPLPHMLEASIGAAVRKGITQSRAVGVTTLGDISRHAAITRSTLAAMQAGESMPRVVSFAEIVGLGKMRHRADEMLSAAFADAPTACLPGISPHAPYTVEGPALRACVCKAIVKRAPLCMHLAELAEEAQFLADLSGPLGHEWDLMQKMDILDEKIPTMPGGPIRWAQRWGLLVTAAGKPRDLPVLLAHANYCDRAELAAIAACSVSVAYCPRTHAFFGHPPHRYREMLEFGINVCLGTDSLASNPDLSVLREAQLLHQRDGIDPWLALEMITRRGAMALGLDKLVGTLSPGKAADLVLMPCEGEDALAQVVGAAPEPAAMWMGGREVRIRS